MSTPIKHFHWIRAPAKHKLKGVRKIFPSANFEAKKETLKTSSTKVGAKAREVETKEKLCSKTKTKKFLTCSSGERALKKEKTFITFYSGELKRKVPSNFARKKSFSISGYYSIARVVNCREGTFTLVERKVLSFLSLPEDWVWI